MQSAIFLGDFAFTSMRLPSAHDNESADEVKLKFVHDSIDGGPSDVARHPPGEVKGLEKDDRLSQQDPLLSATERGGKVFEVKLGKLFGPGYLWDAFEANLIVKENEDGAEEEAEMGNTEETNVELDPSPKSNLSSVNSYPSSGNSYLNADESFVERSSREYGRDDQHSQAAATADWDGSPRTKRVEAAILSVDRDPGSDEEHPFEYQKAGNPGLTKLNPTVSLVFPQSETESQTITRSSLGQDSLQPAVAVNEVRRRLTSSGSSDRMSTRTTWSSGTSTMVSPSADLEGAKHGAVADLESVKHGEGALEKMVPQDVAVHDVYADLPKEVLEVSGSTSTKPRSRRACREIPIMAKITHIPDRSVDDDLTAVQIRDRITNEVQLLRHLEAQSRASSQTSLNPERPERDSPASPSSWSSSSSSSPIWPKVYGVFEARTNRQSTIVIMLLEDMGDVVADRWEDMKQGQKSVGETKQCQRRKG